MSDPKVIRREGDRVMVSYPNGETRVEAASPDGLAVSQWLHWRDVWAAKLADYHLDETGEVVS